MSTHPLPPRRGSGRASGRTGSEEVFASLIEAITTGRLRAGDRLPSEEQLAAHFEVAPMTLRQALAKLREHGYAETRRGRNGGTRVAADIAERLERDAFDHDVSISALRVLTDWRRAVSGEASYLAAIRGTSAERAALQRLEDEYRAVIESTTERRFADARLHIHIAEMSGNARFVEAERGIQDQLTRFIRVTSFTGIEVSHADMDHAELVAAILRGDAGAAKQALLDHVEVTYFWGTRQPNIVGHTAPTDAELRGPVSVGDEAIAAGIRERPHAGDPSPERSADHPSG